jgi:hypothetical protein
MRMGEELGGTCYVINNIQGGESQIYELGICYCGGA